jgi:hypothetical protein
MLDQLTGSEARKLAEQIGEPFKKAPHLPKGFMEFLVKVIPYLAVVGGVLTLLGALQTLSIPLGFSAANSFLQMYVGINPLYWWVTGILSLISGLIMIMAYKPLKARKFEGWMLMFWGNIISLIQMVAGVLMVGTSVIGVVLGLLIGFYVLYEFKPYYGSMAKSAK